MLTASNSKERGKTRRSRLVFAVLGVFTAVVVGVALYTFATLNISYADGERAGLLQKFSRKGWICKTYEGELQQVTLAGAAPVVWNFSVRDEAVARQLTEAMGRRVVLHYTEHPGVPSSCFGDTRYFVDSVRVAE